jgi:dTDP-4-amino-4,6-dideoxygalactose transaminase
MSRPSTGASLDEIPLTRPEFDDAETRAVAEVLASGWVSQGPKVAQFEERFAERVGAKYGVATTSCTTALHVALQLAGIGPGDEVICPSYTFIATSNAVLYAGGTPVFAEIERDTWNLDPQDVLARITPRTKAVIPVHQVGLAADLDGLAPLRARGITIIEDAACAIGSTYKGRPIGSHGNPACFSFHPRKTISTGEGGMLTTDDADLAARARAMRSFCATASAYDRHTQKGLVFESYPDLGYNYRMTDVQAAIGLAQLEKLARLLEGRARAARRYDEAFAGLKHLTLPARPAYAAHAFQSYGIYVKPDAPISRDDLLRELTARRITCRRGIPPIHLEPLYLNRFGKVSLPISEDVGARSLFIPLYGSITHDDQARVIDAVTTLVG